MSKVKRAILCVTNDLSSDQRVHKVAITLSDKLGFTVLLVGRKLLDSNEIARPYKTRRLRLLFTKGPLFYLFFNLRLFLFLLFKKVNIIVSNDLDTLPGCALASRFKKVQLFYDSHELFTEVPELIDRPRIQNIWDKLERKYIGYVHKFYTVCQPIADIYSEKYEKEVAVVRNLPMRKNQKTSDKFIKPTLLYQGALNYRRGIELMIETMKHLPNYNLLIIGKGDVENKLKEQAQKDRLKNVEFKGFVDFNKLNQITARAHIGLSWEEDSGLNYLYALPNKVYDYIQAKIPVLVSNLPGLKSIIDENEVGEVLKSRVPEKIAQQIEILYEKRYTFEDALERGAEYLTWEEEEKVLIDLYTS